MTFAYDIVFDMHDHCIVYNYNLQLYLHGDSKAIRYRATECMLNTNISNIKEDQYNFLLVKNLKMALKKASFLNISKRSVRYIL